MASVWFLPFCLNSGSSESLPRLSLSCPLSLILSSPATCFLHHSYTMAASMFYTKMLPGPGSHAQFCLHSSPWTQEPQCLTVPEQLTPTHRDRPPQPFGLPTQQVHLIWSRQSFRIILDSSFPPQITYSPDAKCLLLLPVRALRVPLYSLCLRLLPGLYLVWASLLLHILSDLNSQPTDTPNAKLGHCSSLLRKGLGQPVTKTE